MKRKKNFRVSESYFNADKPFGGIAVVVVKVDDNLYEKLVNWSNYLDIRTSKKIKKDWVLKHAEELLEICGKESVSIKSIDASEYNSMYEKYKDANKILNSIIEEAYADLGFHRNIDLENAFFMEDFYDSPPQEFFIRSKDKPEICFENKPNTCKKVLSKRISEVLARYEAFKQYEKMERKIGSKIPRINLDYFGKNSVIEILLFIDFLGFEQEDFIKVDSLFYLRQWDFNCGSLSKGFVSTNEFGKDCFIGGACVIAIFLSVDILKKFSELFQIKNLYHIEEKSSFEEIEKIFKDSWTSFNPSVCLIEPKIFNDWHRKGETISLELLTVHINSYQKLTKEISFNSDDLMNRKLTQEEKKYRFLSFFISKNFAFAFFEEEFIEDLKKLNCQLTSESFKKPSSFFPIYKKLLKEKGSKENVDEYFFKRYSKEFRDLQELWNKENKQSIFYQPQSQK